MIICSGDHISVARSFTFYDTDLMAAVYRDLFLPRTLRHVAAIGVIEDSAPSPPVTFTLIEMYYEGSIQGSSRASIFVTLKKVMKNTLEFFLVLFAIE
ncbi:hypothetical protein [Beijerinckia mobilis]|uniref:hypothetical protein n=1 Tax=Beijerinckia mobilis TaxID=231434 RepID=UPI000550F33D|nr:hypothetical protein [Beijerinckia mobilis]